MVSIKDKHDEPPLRSAFILTYLCSFFVNFFRSSIMVIADKLLAKRSGTCDIVEFAQI